MKSHRASALLLVAASSPAAFAQVAVGDVSFVDRAARGEIVLGTVRGSIGVIDFDNDGWFDLFIADDAGRPNRLFRNVPSATVPGGRTFADVTAVSGVGDADGAARRWGGVVVFDYDNDGFSDIYVLGGSADGSSGVLYRNNRNGTFANVSVAAGVRMTGLTPESASAVDFDHDGFADLMVASSGAPGRTLTLLKNAGNGTFVSRPDLLPTVDFSGITYAHAWTDYDHDGWEDCLVCLNDPFPLTLKNVPNPAGGRMLVDATQSSGFTRLGRAPMGIALGDYNGDGWIDAFITDAIVGTYYENRAGTLVRITPFSTFFGWGTTFLDTENDGRLDNYQAGSHRNANIDWLVRNNGDGTFTDARDALNTTALSSQQCARIDFDNDGREDIVTINVGQFVSLYHNQSTGGRHWSTLRLVGGGPTNRAAIGAVVRLTAGGRTQVREIIAGSSFSASEDPRAHFGLDRAAAIDQIEIVWPRAGSLTERTEVYTGPFAIDTVLTLTQRCLRADFNADGFVDFFDLDDFIGAFESGAPGADFNTDGFVDFFDVMDFVEAFERGC